MRKFIVSIILSLFCFTSCDTDKDYETVFLGDSIIKGWDLAYFFPNNMTENKGVGGIRIQDLLAMQIDTQSKNCVIEIGTNNIPLNTKLSDEFRAEFIKSYKSLIESLNSPKITVISILPRDSELSNIEIRKLNTELKEAMASYSKVYFLDVFESFVDGNKMQQGYFSDGIHPNHYGYELLSSSLSKHL